MDGGMDRLMDGWIEAWRVGWMDGGMERWTEGWIN